MQQFEYLVVDNGFMSTNRTGVGSLTDEAQLSKKLTNEYGKQGWQLVAVINDDLVFMRPSVEQVEKLDALQKKSKTTKKAASNE